MWCYRALYTFKTSSSMLPKKCHKLLTPRTVFEGLFELYLFSTSFIIWGIWFDGFRNSRGHWLRHCHILIDLIICFFVIFNREICVKLNKLPNIHCYCTFKSRDWSLQVGDKIILKICRTETSRLFRLSHIKIGIQLPFLNELELEANGSNRTSTSLKYSFMAEKKNKTKQNVKQQANLNSKYLYSSSIT